MTTQSAIIDKVSAIALGTSEVTFTIPEPFSFIAGQYVTITLPSLKNLPIKEQFRDFSIASSPEDTGHIAIAVRNSESHFKKELLRSDKTTQVSIEGPKGIFILPENADTPVVFIAGGIGVTPFLSMIRHIVLSKTPVKPTFMYYNHSAQTALYIDELKGYTDSLNLISVFGHMTQKEVAEYLRTQPKESLWYLAGPRGMVNTAREILTTLRVAEGCIKSEEFTGY